MLCKNVQPGIETFASQNLIFSRQLRGDRPLFAAMAYDCHVRLFSCYLHFFNCFNSPEGVR